MSAAQRLVFNGKFLSAEPTGVHRVAEELIKAFYGLLKAEPALKARFQPEIWVPHNALAGAERMGLPYRVIGPLAGIPWEQLTLPWHARGRTLVSLCNVGPMLSRDAVTMFHDAQVHISPASYSAGFRAWYRLHQPIAGAKHRRILTVSNYSKEQLVSFGIADASCIGVVHNGVDHALHVKPDAAILAKLGLAPQSYVLALASTQAHKNVGLLLKAFADARLRGLKLVLFGAAGPQSFTAQGLEMPANAVFAGRVSDAQLAALYQHALCLAFPSLTEGFGLPPLEAMAWGCPAVVAPCGALPEVCGDAAIFAAPDDVNSWVEALTSLQTQPVLRAAKHAMSLQQAQRFTWQAAARRLIDELHLS